MQFGLMVTDFMLICRSQCFRHGIEPFVETTNLRARLGREREKIWSPQFATRKTKPGQAFPYLCDCLFIGLLFGYGPASQNRRKSQYLGEAVLHRECDYSLRALFSCKHVPPKLMDSADRKLRNC